MKARNHSRYADPVSTLLLQVEAALLRVDVRGRDVLVAVSGGLDSVCLLQALAALRGEAVGRVEVAHVDHGLRSDSDEDAQFCRRLAEELGMVFHLRCLGLKEFLPGRGVQAEARRLRRAFFEEVRRVRDLGAVALGHHADDQAETVLFRLVRGTGPRGVRGMSAWDPPYVRPLLGLRRADLEAAVAAQGWAFREDPSNASPRFLRNRIRHEVLPLLAALNPSVVEALGRFAGLAADDDDLLSAVARAELTELARPEPEGLRLSAESLLRHPLALRRRLYLAVWEAVGCDPSVLEARHLEAVDALLEPGRPHRWAPVPGPGGFARSYGDLWGLAPGFRSRPSGPVALRDGEPSSLPGGAGVAVAWGPTPPDGVPHVGLEEGRPGTLLVARPWRPGDRVDGRKVKDLLMEACLPAWRRQRAVLVEDGDEALGLLAQGRAWSAARPGRTVGALWLEAPRKEDHPTPA
ncbi:MAG: tRNA lysidine(34) synthetase TilS [Deltaproteobacteria bacterium]|nr:tRNA lysidine(34) synthetase TilS [Deltaproteobacteria bacterium]